MKPCCGCGAKLNFDTPGVIIKTISADISPKSGRPIPQDDFFPDGSSEKFLCATCLFEKDIAIILGFYEQGHDTPMEELGESNHVHRMPQANLSW